MFTACSKKSFKFTSSLSTMSIIVVVVVVEEEEELCGFCVSEENVRADMAFAAGVTAVAVAAAGGGVVGKGIRRVVDMR